MKIVSFVMNQLVLFFVAIVSLLLNSCSRTSDKNGLILINTDDDPAILAYRFVQNGRNAGLVNPITLDSDNEDSEYSIRNLWRALDSMSYVIFDHKVGPSRDFQRQVTIKTTKIQSHVAFDFDNDNIDEVAIIYSVNDSLWLEILDAYDDHLYKKCLFVGVDQDNSGRWDGNCHITNVFDINGDGYAEIFLVSITGFDFSPRNIVCLDWFNNKKLWTYDVAGHIEKNGVFIVSEDHLDSNLVIFGVSAPCNGYEINDMSDSFSYLVCLDTRGELRWRKVLTHGLSGARIRYIDYNNNEIPEFLAKFSTLMENGKQSGGLIVYDTNGECVDSVYFAHKIVHFDTYDLKGDGDIEVVVSLADNTVRIYSQTMQLIAKYQCDKSIKARKCGDFLKMGTNKILASTGDGSLCLFNNNFELLARLPEGGVPVIFHSKENDVTVAVQHAGYSRYFKLERNPWYAVFSRQPLLAFLAGAVPLGFIAAVIWFILAKFRRKNRIIGQQRDRLDEALSELKRAQRLLIAAEKYKQAKDIAGGVAHEIRNALNPARHSLEMLKQQFVPKTEVNPELGSELVEITEEAVTRSLDMTELVTAYSQIESEKSDHCVNLEWLIAEVVNNNRIAIREKGISLKIQIEKGVCLSYNKAHAYCLFNNLLLNSIDALSNMSARAISVEANAKDNILRIEFSDTGCGIAQESMSRIFDLFFSTKPDTGTGVGLAMVKKIVELYNGQIEVKSNLDNGAKFIILQPIAQTNQTESDVK